MNILKTLRKPWLAVIMAGLILFVSCDRGENPLPEERIDATTLEQIHQEVKYDLEQADPTTLKAGYLQKEMELYANMEYVNENGVDALFEREGIDLKYLDMLDMYFQFENQPEVYQLLLDQYEFLSDQEAIFFFAMVESYNILSKELSLDDESLMKAGIDGRIPLKCVLAIAGALGATASAALVTGGVSLVLFLINKGLATAAIIDACT